MSWFVDLLRQINDQLGLGLMQSAIKLPDWSPNTKWDAESLKLLKDFKANPLPTVSVDDIINNTEHFPIELQTKTNQCTFLKSKMENDVLIRNIRSVYPLLHESILKLCCDFILFKRQHGNDIEKEYYKNFTLKDLVNKMLKKRAVGFIMMPIDKYLLLNGKFGMRNWEHIGTSKEKDPLTIDELMSYDELKLSAFLSITSYTYFVNKGHRTNVGIFEEDRNTVEDDGIIIGMIGTRIEKERVMEYQDIIISKTQNTKDNGFGTEIQHSIPKLFLNFYQEQPLTYDEAVTAKHNDSRGQYTKILKDKIFDNHIYYKRLSITLDTLLIEANSRAKSSSKSAYLHVVGLGLGVWKISDHQNKVYMDAFAERLNYLGEKLHNISDICFAYINQTKCGNYRDKQIFPIKNHPNGGIKIHIVNRDPHERLTGEDKGKLLVVSYAWDGNALPGNEYWYGSLEGSSDPAAACSTQICEVHNPHINPLVCTDNLKIVTKDGVVSLEEYQKIVEKKYEL